MMRDKSICFRRPCRLLIGLVVLILTDHLDSAPYKPEHPPSHLYMVRMRDAESGKNKIGFIDKTGKLVIGFDRFPEGAELDDFSEGLAAICFADKTERACRALGFIDTHGKIAVAPRFKRCTKYSEGLAYVEADETRGFIDKRGKIVIELKPTEQSASDFHEGMAVIATTQGFTFMDRSGKLMHERYRFAERFSEGLAAVAIDKDLPFKFGFINKTGKLIIPPQFQRRVEGAPDSFIVADMITYSEGLARVWNGESYGYINKSGYFVIPPRFLRAGNFSEGLAAAAENGKVGYLDRFGHWAIAPKFALGSIVSIFKEGLAPVAVETNQGTLWGYINSGGKLVIKPKFAEAHPFGDGVAEVYLKDKSGQLIRCYINKAGGYLWKPSQ